jgi:hypothetical protein
MTKTFDNEMAAKEFARQKFNDGLALFAGTINPYAPKQLILGSQILMWLDGAQVSNPAEAGSFLSKNRGGKQ